MYQLIFYVPKNHVESVKAAVFATGAGRLGDYEQCSWQVEGQGQFKPLPNSQPFLGEQDVLEVVSEYRVEMICEAQFAAAVIDALKSAHPYEAPVYHLVEIVL